MKRNDNLDDILPPTAFVHHQLALSRRRQIKEEEDQYWAETEAMLSACPDTFIFYEKGTNDLFIIHMPLRVRLRNYMDIFTDWEERQLRALAESVLIHVRLSE